MKTFRYTAREPGGSVRQGTLEARDRAAAVTALRADGVVPLSLQEGAAAVSPGARLLARRPLILALAAVIVVAVAAVVLLRRAPQEVAAPTEAVVPAPAVTVPARVTTIPPARVTDVTPAAPRPAAGAVEAPDEAEPVVAGQPPSEAEATEPPPPRRRPGVRVTDKDGNELFKPRPEIKTQTDRFLWAIVNSKGSGMIPVSVPLIKRDFEQALQASIEHMPDDTPEDIAAKQGVEQLKQEIGALMAEGHTLDDIILVIQRERNALADYRRGAQQTFFNLVREGKLEEAAAYQKATNQELAKESVAPLYVPDKLLEAGIKKAEENEAAQPPQ